MQSGDNFQHQADAPEEHPQGQNVRIISYCSRCGTPWNMDLARCGHCGYEMVIPPTGDHWDPPVTGNGSNDRVNHRMGGATWGVKHIIIGIILVMLSLFTAAALALMAGNIYPEQEDAVATWISVHLMGLAIVGTIWYLGLRHTRFPLAVLRLSRVQVPRKRTVFLMLSVLATSLIATSIYSGIVEWLEADKLKAPTVEADIFFDGVAVILTFQALAFITPLSEELFFRGFIFRGLIPKVGPYGAMLISAAIFSGFHLSVGVLIPIFITGFLLAWLYWRTGSLWAPIGAHAGQNALALIATALT